MKETPILFKPEMIRAILSGKKTQTRRLIKPQPTWHDRGYWVAGGKVWLQEYAKCPYGRKGDLLWVKETFVMINGEVVYAADYQTTRPYAGCKYTSPLFMRKEYSRLWLELTADPIPQRLQDITEKDAFAEGISEFFKNGLACPQFAYLWESINGPGTWKKTPWVWKLEFKRV